MTAQGPARVTFVVGYCGSGKTYRCDQIKALTGAERFEHVASRGRAQLIAHLRQGRHATVEDCTYCNPVRRREVEEELRAQGIHGLEIEWEFFENDRGKADSNCRKRPPKGPDEGTWQDHVAFNADNERVYWYPPDARVWPIHEL